MATHTHPVLNAGLYTLLPSYCGIRTFNLGQEGTQGVVVLCALPRDILLVSPDAQSERKETKILNWMLMNKSRHGKKQSYQSSCPHPSCDGHSSGVLLSVPGCEGMGRSSAVPVN